VKTISPGQENGFLDGPGPSRFDLSRWPQAKGI
jgi:hypothetical protein